MAYDSRITSATTATNDRLGVVKVGTGLNVDDAGTISTIVSPGGVPVKLVSSDYTILPTDYYIGAINAPITITLPLGIFGKFYIVKNQVEEGVITVAGFAGEKIDNVLSKNLGPESSLMIMFDGKRWNVIQ